jgi:hypothetical protein
MFDRREAIYLELRSLATSLPDSSDVPKAIDTRSPLTQIRQAAAFERANREGLSWNTRGAYQDVIGVAGYGEPFLAGDETVTIANYVSDFSIEDGFGHHTAGQSEAFLERLLEQELPYRSLDWLLCGPGEAEAIEQLAKETFDHATLTLRRRLVVRAPEWPGGPVADLAGNRLVPCGICGRLYPREPYVTAPPACSPSHAQNVEPVDQNPAGPDPTTGLPSPD